MDFGEQTQKAVNNILTGFQQTMGGTAVELFGEVVQRTPLKVGHAISNWKASVGVAASEIPTSEYNYSTYEPQTTTMAISERFKSEIRPTLMSAELTAPFYLKNKGDERLAGGRPYIMLLENGGYNRIPEHTEDPYPPYYPSSVYGTSYTLLTGRAISKKAPQGMVKITLAGALRVFKKMFGIYGR